MSRKKKKGVFMKIVVALVILQVIAYTWIHMYLSYKVGVEIAPMTTVAFYSFCGLEVGICGLLKKNDKD